MGSRLRRALGGLVLAVLVGCTAPTPPIVTPTPIPSFKCTPITGGAEYDCSQVQHEQMVAEQKLYEEAEAVFRKYLAEDTRIMRLGGVSEPTPVLLETTSGAFLEDVMEYYRYLKDERVAVSGGDPTLVMWRPSPQRQKAGSVASVTTCTDHTDLEFVYPDGARDTGLLAQDDNYFIRENGKLKLMGADGENVVSCD